MREREIVVKAERRMKVYEMTEEEFEAFCAKHRAWPWRSILWGILVGQIMFWLVFKPMLFGH